MLGVLREATVLTRHQYSVMTTVVPVRPAIRRYLRRGQFPDDAESAYKRWRDTATDVALPEGMAADSFEEFVRTIWLAGWYGRGRVAYDEADIPPDPKKGG